MRSEHRILGHAEDDQIPAGIEVFDDVVRQAFDTAGGLVVECFHGGICLVEQPGAADRARLIPV